MTCFTEAQWKRLNTLLDEQQGRLRRQLAAIISKARPPQSVEPVEAAELAALETSERTEDVMQTHYQRELAKVEGARSRMLKHQYGVCVDCGASIPFLRLQAQPTALRCLTCQAARERRWA